MSYFENAYGAALGRCAEQKHPFGWRSEGAVAAKDVLALLEPSSLNEAMLSDEIAKPVDVSYAKSFTISTT